MLPLFTLFTLPENALASTTAYIGEVITDAWVFVGLAIGVPLAFYVIHKVKGIIPKR